MSFVPLKLFSPLEFVNFKGLISILDLLFKAHALLIESVAVEDLSVLVIELRELLFVLVSQNVEMRRNSPNELNVSRTVKVIS